MLWDGVMEEVRKHAGPRQNDRRTYQQVLEKLKRAEEMMATSKTNKDKTVPVALTATERSEVVELHLMYASL